MSIFRLLTGRRKAIDLQLARYFPEGHKRSPEATHFGSKILSRVPSKIHAVCFDQQKWSKVGKKTPLWIVYRECRNMQVSTTRITKCERIGIQSVIIPHSEDSSILIDNREVPLELFCRNEGLNQADFRDWYKYDGGRKAVVVHFSDFRY